MPSIIRWRRSHVLSGNRRTSQAGIPARSRTTNSKMPEPSSVPTAATALARPRGARGSPRNHNSRASSTPAAEAEAGSRRSAGSTHAARTPSPVERATRERTSPVRPEEEGPCTSETCPRGMPPCSNASTLDCPVASGARLRPMPRNGGPSARRRRARRISSRAILRADDISISPFLRHAVSARPRSQALRRARGGSGGCDATQPALRAARTTDSLRREGGGSRGRDTALNPQATGRARAEFTSASARGVWGVRRSTPQLKTIKSANGL